MTGSRAEHHRVMVTQIPPAELSFPEVFARSAQLRPGTVALEEVRSDQGQPEATQHTFADLFERTRLASAVIHDCGVRAGDRVALCIADVSEFFAFLVGAQCLGAIAVPLPSPREIQIPAYVHRIGSVVRDATPRAILVDDARAFEAIPPEARAGAKMVNVRDPLAGAASRGTPPGFEPARSLAETSFLQYTSGSTGAPKGVVVLHGNLVANLRAFIEAARIDSGDSTFSWLPLFHDMGLIVGLLLGLYLRIPTYVAPPRSFVASPVSWLRAMSKFGATISAGPNFAYDVLARRIPSRALAGLDLSRWRLAIDGAEIVDPTTVTAFLERYGEQHFSPAAFCPGYGLAEATLAVALSRPGNRPRLDCVDRSSLVDRGRAVPCGADADDAVIHTSVGVALPGHQIRILAVGSDEVIPDRHAGEVAVVGPSVTPGYFHELQKGAAPRTVLRTGDWGYLADGELFIVDRIKDLLVVAGRKFAPADVEQAVGSVSGVRAGAVIAFSTRASGTEEVHILAGVRPKIVPREVQGAIREVLRVHFGLPATNVFLVRPAFVPRTSSGKLRRSECVALLASGALEQHARSAHGVE